MLFFMKAADYKSIVSVIPKEGLLGPRPPILFWYDNNKDIKRHIFVACDSLLLSTNKNTGHLDSFNSSRLIT